MSSVAAEREPDIAPAPRLYVEPPIPTATEFSTVEHVRSVIAQLDAGRFRTPALLVERMLSNPRLRAVVETRLAGLISAKIRWRPAKNSRGTSSRDAKLMAREIEKDWPLIAPAPMRKQMLKWSLFLGAGFAQRVLVKSKKTGRGVYQLRPFWPGFASYHWHENAYRIQTHEGVVSVPSPSAVNAPNAAADDIATPLARPVWVVCEPFGTNSYRDGLVHAAWRPWLGHDWAMRDQARASEKHGLGIILAGYPRGGGDQHKAAVDRFVNGIRTMGAEGVIPLEDRGEGEGKFSAAPLEFNGSGFQAISDTLGANAVAMAILFLGHNLTTEIKGGGSYAAAGVADYIRDDKKHDDAEIERSYSDEQLVEQWAIRNYANPEEAPVPEYVTDSPTVNLQRAQMINQMALAAAYLKANVPRVDLDALAEEFRLPILADAVKVQVAGVPPENDGETTDSAKASEEEKAA